MSKSTSNSGSNNSKDRKSSLIKNIGIILGSFWKKHKILSIIIILVLIGGVGSIGPALSLIGIGNGGSQTSSSDNSDNSSNSTSDNTSPSNSSSSDSSSSASAATQPFNSNDGSSAAKAISISTSDVAKISGSDFVKKYQGKYISFDGMAMSTLGVVTVSSNTTDAAVLLAVGDDDMEIQFAPTDNDASGIAMDLMYGSYAVAYAPVSNYLASSLQRFNQPYMPDSSTKVHVVAKVTYYDSTSKNVILTPDPNSTENNPAVTSR